MMHFRALAIFLISAFFIAPLSYAETNGSKALTKAAYVSLLAKKYPNNPYIPKNAATLSKAELFKAVTGNMAAQGINAVEGMSGDSLVTRKEFINITYSFITGKPGNSYIENKLFLKDNGIINPRDIGIISSYEGNVVTYRENSDEAITITGTEPVFFKDTAETDEDSKIEFEFDDLSLLTLGEDTIVEINQLIYDPVKNTRQVLVKLHQGKLRAKVSKLDQSKTNFAVQTPTAVIGVRGTDFMVDYNKETQKTNVVTFEGLVAVKPFTPKEQKQQKQQKQKKRKKKAAEESTEAPNEQPPTGEGLPPEGQPEPEGEGFSPTTDTSPEIPVEEFPDFESSPDEILVGENSAAQVSNTGIIETPAMTIQEIHEAKQEVVVEQPTFIAENGVVSINEGEETLEKPTFSTTMETFIPEATPTEQQLPPKEEGQLQQESNTLPDGTKVLPDGTQILPDGTQILPDGTMVLPDGTTQAPPVIKDQANAPMQTDPATGMTKDTNLQANSNIAPLDPNATGTFFDPNAAGTFIDPNATKVVDPALNQTNQNADITNFQTATQTTTNTLNLTAAEIAALTPAEISALTTSQIAALTATQISALLPSQISALTTTQLPALTVIQIAKLTPSQISAFSSVQAQSLTTDQIHELIFALTAPLKPPVAGANTTDLTTFWTKLSSTQQAYYVIGNDIIDLNLTNAQVTTTITELSALMGQLTQFQLENLIIETEINPQLTTDDVVSLGLGEYFWDSLSATQQAEFATRMVTVYDTYTAAQMDLLILRGTISQNLWNSLTATQKANFSTNLWASLTTQQKEKFTYAMMPSSGGNNSIDFISSLTAAQLATLQTAALTYWNSLTPGAQQDDFLYSPSAVASSLWYSLDRDGDGMADNVDPYPTTFDTQTLSQVRSAETAASLSSDIAFDSLGVVVVIDPDLVATLIQADLNDGDAASGLSTLAELDAGTFLPFVYTTDNGGYGLQAGSYLTEEAYGAMNKSAFLSYAVQVEEDVMNQAILEEHAKTTLNTGIQTTVNSLLTASDLRARDAYLAQNADAQAGRVLKDVHGNWVRAQQYVLRPATDEVQVISATLRASTAGTLAGMSVMNWRTILQTGSSFPTTGLQNLPWGDWLTTLGTSMGGADPFRVKNTSAYPLSEMKFETTSPTGEVMAIGRTFDPIAGSEQIVLSDGLALGNNYVYGASYTYSNNANAASTFTIVPTNSNPNGPGGFQIQFYTTAGVMETIDASFYVVGNSVTPGTTGEVAGYTGIAYNDIWAALASSMVVPGTTTQLAQDIGNHNLEMRFVGAGKTVDFIYVPLDNMDWLK